MEKHQAPVATIDDETNNLIRLDKQIRLVCFKLGDHDYTVDAADTIEILRIVAVTALPDAPDFVAGIINLRGEIVPIIDLRLRFGLEQKLYSLNTPIIVVNSAGGTIGLIVDQVSEVITVFSSEIIPEHAVPNSRFVKGVVKHDDRLLLITDADGLLDADEERSIQQALGCQVRKQPELGGKITVEEFHKTG